MKGVLKRGETWVFRVSGFPLTLDKRVAMPPILWHSLACASVFATVFLTCGGTMKGGARVHTGSVGELVSFKDAILYYMEHCCCCFSPGCLSLLSTPRRHEERMSLDFPFREEWMEPPNVKVWESLAAEVG
uniref:Uncharacterized protein n=1 Tax=Rousettus aegyptiacus TaxID=9407 RepID=A0A7J8GAK1_ROUAE|nr:hypothetical protein HJG63_011489 [Rousettus aegyptiacus]